MLVPSSYAAFVAALKSRLNVALPLNSTLYRMHQSTRLPKIRELLALYVNNQAEILDAQIKALYSEEEAGFVAKYATTKNITAEILDKCCLAFSEAPTLVIKAGPDEGAADLTELWNNEIDEGRRLMSVMRAIEPLTVLVNDIAVSPYWRPLRKIDPATEPGDDDYQMEFEYYTPDMYGVIPDPNDPTQPCVIALNATVDAGEQAGIDTMRMPARSIWTPETVDIISVKGDIVSPDWLPENKDGVNPYQFIPVTIFRSRRPIGRDFYASLAEDLGSYNKMFNLARTNLNYIKDYQGFGVPFATNLSKEDRDKTFFGVRKIVHLETTDGSGPAQFGFASPNAPLAVLMQDLIQMQNEIKEKYGVAPKALTPESGNRQSPSGRSKQQDNIDLIEITKRYREHIEPALTELVAKTMLVWKQWNAGVKGANQIPENYREIRIDVRWPPQVRATDDASTYETRRVQAMDGMYSLVGIFREQHPEIADDAAALDQMKKNKELNKQLGLADGKELAQVVALLHGGQMAADGAPANGQPGKALPGGDGAPATAATPKQLPPPAAAKE